MYKYLLCERREAMQVLYSIVVMRRRVVYHQHAVGLVSTVVYSFVKKETLRFRSI